MTCKEFFKSNVFKCLVTLLCVLLISGIFLTLMNGLLAVSDQERLDRAINKIYGKSVAYTQVEVANYNDNANIDAAYRIKDDGNYLVKATGKYGFDNGTVTCWIVVNVKNGAIKGIDKVVIDSNKGQSYIDRVTEKALNEFTEKYEEGIIYTPSLITGATVTSTKNAICNAVNGAIDYVNGKFLGNVATAGEKLLRSLTAVYGDKQISVYGLDGEDNEVLITDESEDFTGINKVATPQGNATVNSVYKVKFKEGDKDVLHYVVEAIGHQGYKDGTVTVLTAIAVEDGKLASVYKVAVTDNVLQSLLSDIDYLDKFTGAELADGTVIFTTGGGYNTSGATYTSVAINNAVNGSVAYLGKIELENGQGGNP